MFGKSVHYGRSVIQLKSVPIEKKPISLCCNYMPIFYRFRDITIYWSKMYGFCHLPTLVGKWQNGLLAWYTVVKRWSLTGEVSLSCAQPAANGWPFMWLNRPL